MIVRCLACGKTMIADDKHPGFQVCGCKNETMVDWCDETAFENAKRKWKEAGLELPTVVFWNVDARSDNVPATKFDRNVTLISGSNQNAFRFAMEGKTPEQLMHEVIDSDRYKHIKA